MKKRTIVRNMFLNVVGTQATQSLTTGPPGHLMRVVLTGDFTATVDNDFYLVQLGYVTTQLQQALNDQPVIAEFRGRVRQAAVLTSVLWSINEVMDFGPHGLFIPGGTLLSTFFSVNTATLTGRLFLVFVI